MNILLVGHKGYIGRGVMEYLGGAHRVTGWDKEEDIFNLSSAILSRKRIDLLVNLSACAADRQSRTFKVDSPSDSINVEGARHIARVLKGSKIVWIQISSREVLGPVYGRADVRKTRNGYRPRFLVDESFGYNPQNCFGKSKVISELICESHPFSNVIRLASPYTDYSHSSGGWILQIVKNAVGGLPVRLTRGGEQFRDPLHSDDLGRLIELLFQRKVVGEVIHAGGGRKNLISLREFVRLANPRAQIEDVAGGDYGFAFDNRKARELTGWEPEVLVRDKIPVLIENFRC